MKTIFDRRARSYLVHTARLAVALFGCGCYGEPRTTADRDAGDTSDAQLPVALVGSGCIRSADCVTGHCVDGVCCDTPCSGSCQSCSLTGKVGTCTPVRNTPDDSCAGGLVCNSLGTCLKALGETCTGLRDCASGNCVDGVCCGNATCGTCQSCALPGSLGICAIVPALTEDADSGCAGNSTCNDVGECRAKNGQTCAAAADCLSQQCADGICCENACTGTCYSCNQPGKLGTCAPLVRAEDLEATTVCAGTAFCEATQDEAPVCTPKLADGERCAFALECASGVCATYYSDGDGDGYGVIPVKACGQEPPPGTAPQGGDCCDSAANTHPGVTTYSRIKTPCGTYDFNCDGFEERNYDTTAKCGTWTPRDLFADPADSKAVYCR